MKTENKNRLGIGLGALLAAGLFGGPALGDTLQEELEAALQTSPVLARERARLEAVREARTSGLVGIVAAS